MASQVPSLAVRLATSGLHAMMLLDLLMHHFDVRVATPALCELLSTIRACIRLWCRRRVAGRNRRARAVTAARNDGLPVIAALAVASRRRRSRGDTATREDGGSGPDVSVCKAFRKRTWGVVKEAGQGWVPSGGVGAAQQPCSRSALGQRGHRLGRVLAVVSR